MFISQNITVIKAILEQMAALIKLYASRKHLANRSIHNHCYACLQNQEPKVIIAHYDNIELKQIVAGLCSGETFMTN